MAILCGLAAAQVLSSADHSTGYAAAKYLAARMGLARTQAVAQGTAIGLRFEQLPRGVTFTTFQDGNGNGIRLLDIQAGVDREIEPATSIFERFPGADVGLSADSPAANAVTVGQSGLLTFTPLGTATSGTIYVRDRRGTQWAVRVLGATGRIRVLRYDSRQGSWVVAQ